MGWGIYPSSVKTLLLVTFIIVYLVAGALVFLLLEAGNEDQLRKDIENLRQEFLDSHICLSGKYEFFLSNGRSTKMNHTFV